MKRIETQVDLPAVPSVVWAAAGGHAAMGSWNPFITSLSGVLAVGERLEVRIAPVGGRPMTFKPRVTVVEPASAWSGSAPWALGLFDGRHAFTLTPLGSRRTRLVQAENGGEAEHEPSLPGVEGALVPPFEGRHQLEQVSGTRPRLVGCAA